MVPLIAYLSATIAPGSSVGLKEYSWPHFGQKPFSRVSFASQLEQKRFRSGTTPGTMAASGSCGGSGGRASGTPPKAREVCPVRPLRPEPVRVERALRVLRALRVDGVRPEPVRADPVGDPIGVVPVGAGVVAAPAMPHTLQ